MKTKSIYLPTRTHCVQCFGGGVCRERERAIEQIHNKAHSHNHSSARSVYPADANDITQLFCYIIRAIESRVTIWSCCWRYTIWWQIYELKLFWPPMLSSSKKNWMQLSCRLFIYLPFHQIAHKMFYYDIIIISIYIGAIIKSFIWMCLFCLCYANGCEKACVISALLTSCSFLLLRWVFILLIKNINKFWLWEWTSRCHWAL